MAGLESIAGWAVAGAGVYLAAGAVAALWLQAAGLKKLDPSVTGSGIAFRLVVLPGLITLWPLLILAARRPAPPVPEAGYPPRQLRRRHRTLVSVVAVLTAPLLAMAIAFRSPDPSDPSTFPMRTAALSQPLSSYGIALAVRGDTSGRWLQLRATLDRPLPMAHAALYWCPQDRKSGSIESSQFLGMLDGPGAFEFPVPAAIAQSRGRFVVVSLADGKVLAPAEGRS